MYVCVCVCVIETEFILFKIDDWVKCSSGGLTWVSGFPYKIVSDNPY